ncbi:MAG TPA: hypothetical protein VFP61_10075, partial [Acidimicrobiales bacterium]|nr:hypothetical protein [Acidimicrobiales bacterium]
MSGRRINKSEVGRSVRWMRARQRALLVAVAAGATALPAATALVQPAHADPGTAQRVIVEAASDTAALSDVSSAGGSAIAALASSGGAAALMTPTQQAAAEAQGAVVVPDNPVGVAATTSAGTHPPSAVYPQVTDASPLVSAGVNGAGVAVAVLDTGI